MNRILIGAAALLVAVAVSACSGDDTPSDAANEMAGMNMDSSSDGSGMAMTPLAETTWEGMRVSLASSAPTTFTIFQGDERQEVTPQPSDSVHLMALLADEETSERIPYATVWVTVTDEDGNIAFDERMWPMISRTMGIHYGTNVPLPTAGTYTMAVQVGPPQAARHPEYADRWLEAQTFEATIEWDGGGS